MNRGVWTMEAKTERKNFPILKIQSEETFFSMIEQRFEELGFELLETSTPASLEGGEFTL